MPYEPNQSEREDFIDPIITNMPSAPVGPVVLWGFLGLAEPEPEPTSPPTPPNTKAWRLYRNLRFNEYLEIQNEDIISGKHAANPLNPFGGTFLWVQPNAKVQYVRTQTLEVQGSFLQGPINAGGEGGYASGGGGGTSFACPGGGTSFACPGGGTSFACPGGGTSFACPGGGTSFACPGGGTSFACPGGGASFAGCW